MDFDYWSFVACCRCQLPFDAIKTQTPFWLTECGHVVCNNHLRSDRSCAQCGATDILLAPLQREMEAPMCEWFQPISQTLETIAFAAKFQQQTMAAQLKYYKARSQKDRGMIDHLKAENAELQKMNESLQFQLQEQRQPAERMNPNGKRRMIEQDRYSDRGPGTSSSPHSVIAPLGPNRLTLPPGQQPLQLANRDEQDQYAQQDLAENRPGSNRYNERYSYALPETQEFRHAARQFQPVKLTDEQPQTAQRSMLPPNQPFATPRFSQNNGLNLNTATRRPTLPPAQMTLMNQTLMRPSTSAAVTNSQRFVPPTPSGPTRFVPGNNNNNNNSRQPSRMKANGGSQRKPFVPGTFG